QDRDDVDADGLVELVEQFFATAIFMPGQNHVGVHAEGMARREQCQRVLFAIVVTQHAVATIERALGNGVEQREGGYHCTSGQYFDAKLTPCHVVDLLGEVEGELVEDVNGGPGALETEGRGGLRLDNGREAECCGGCRTGCSPAQKTAARCLYGCFGTADCGAALHRVSPC